MQAWESHVKIMTIGLRTWLAKRTASSLWLVRACRTKFINQSVSFNNRRKFKANTGLLLTVKIQVELLKLVVTLGNSWYHGKSLNCCIYKQDTLSPWDRAFTEKTKTCPQWENNCTHVKGELTLFTCFVQTVINVLNVRKNFEIETW